VALAPRNEHSVLERPNRDEVILPTRRDISTVWRPAYTHEAPVVAPEYI
jgi:hypothetical protein